MRLFAPLNLEMFAPFDAVVLCVDATVYRLYQEAFSRFPHLWIVPSHESSKSFSMGEKLIDFLGTRGISKQQRLVAIGGGVVLDLCGFVASIYCRGIEWIAVPTTLTAMVDVSVGGKNGINMPFGKNYVGTVYAPEQVWVDTKFLDTLPAQELANGYVEMLKIASLLDACLFQRLQKACARTDLYWDLDSIQAAIRWKEWVVMRDKSVQGFRDLLNFGHTVGHALECAHGYTMSHGRSCAWGMVVESFVGEALGFVEPGVGQILWDTWDRMGVLGSFPFVFQEDTFWRALETDKKNVAGHICLCVCQHIGRYARTECGVKFCVSPYDIERAIQRLASCSVG